MAEIGMFLSSEEHGPRDLLSHARAAEEAGFRAVLISDHFHPWIDAQGESPFVWSVIGGIAATTRLKVTTGVTCPIMRIHPVVLAQAAITSQLMLDGRFVLGVGSGEALNEHITGEHWPPAPTRLEMLEEAIGIMRELFSGSNTTHYGRHFTVENARLYSCADVPPPVLVSAFGPAALDVAARVGDGYVTTQPDADALAEFRSKHADGLAVAALKVCWDPDESRARKLAHQLWPSECLPGQLNQELPTPAHFEQAVTLVTEDQVADAITCGPDPERHVAAVTEYLEAGFDEVYVNQVGPDQAGFIEFFRRELQPRLGT